MKHRQRTGLQRIAVSSRDGRVIGLDVGGTAVRAAVLSPRTVDGRASVSLHTVGRVGLPRGAVVNGAVREPQLVTNAVKNLWQQFRIDSRTVIVGVTSQQVVVREVELPDLPPAERVRALPFQARDVIALPVERAILDFIPVGEADPTSHTVPGLLVAAPREPVSVLVRAVEQAGLRVARVDLAAFAALRAVADETAGVGAVIDLGAHVTNVVIHNQGVPQLVRTVARGGDELTKVVASRMGTDTDGAELAKRTVGLADRSSPVFEAVNEALRPLLSELGSSIRLFEQTHPDALVEQITLTGGGAGLPGLVGLLAQATDIPVEVAAPMRHVGSHRAAKPADAQDPNHAASAVCVGLAMGAAA